MFIMIIICFCFRRRRRRRLFSCSFFLSLSLTLAPFSVLIPGILLACFFLSLAIIIGSERRA